jgi:hypothetical protein
LLYIYFITLLNRKLLLIQCKLLLSSADRRAGRKDKFSPLQRFISKEQLELTNLFAFRHSAEMAADYERTLPAGAGSRIAPYEEDDLSMLQPEQQDMLTDPSSVFELLNPLGMHL